jgi:magnesium chelatase family protein
MGNARVASRAQLGLAAPRVEVEVHLGSGLPVFSIVGMPATAVKESKDRVRAAITNSGFEFPAGRIIVNLSPADLPKEGCRYDLPIALGILLASTQLHGTGCLPDDTEFYGELGLAGELKPIKGVVLAGAHAAREQRRVLVPMANVNEARLAAPSGTLGANSLLEVCALFSARNLQAAAAECPVAMTPASITHNERAPDLADVRGQAQAKRALVIAAAGGHSLLKLWT